MWGTGHTNDNGIGDAGEGVAITLVYGEVQNGTETTVEGPLAPERIEVLYGQ